MTDYTNVGYSSSITGLKLIKEDSGSGTIPATGAPSDESTIITIPHGHTSDKLAYRVLVVVPGYPTYSNYFVVPFAVSGLIATPSIDTTNLYIEVGQSGNSLPAQAFSYYYRIFAI